jgi:hypothetical protein
LASQSREIRKRSILDHFGGSLSIDQVKKTPEANPAAPTHEENQKNLP